MAILDWPIGQGYAEFSAMPRRARGPYVQRSAFTGKSHVSYGGGRRRQGHVVTPVHVRTGAVPTAFTTLMASLADPVNQLRLQPPETTSALDLMVVQVLDIEPPERDDRGVWRGWRLRFVEILADIGLPLDVTGHITGAADTDSYDFKVIAPRQLSIVWDGRDEDNTRGDCGLSIWQVDGDTTVDPPLDKRVSDFITRDSDPFYSYNTWLAGRYYAIAGRYTDDDTDTDYRLRIQYPGSVVLSADGLSYNGDIVGTSDMDVYTFFLSASASVKVTLTPLAVGTAGDLGFSWQSDANAIIAVDDRRLGGVMSQTRAVSAGSYAIFIGHSTDQLTNTQYTLTVEIVP